MPKYALSIVAVIAYCSIVSMLLAPAAVLAEVTTIREATAAGPQGNAQAGIQATVTAFINDLGGANNGNVVGSQGSGRRQITWDGGDNDAAPARLPNDFFNAIAPRGVVFKGFTGQALDNDARGQFQISADVTPAVPGTLPEFGNINATYPTAFSVFSSPRLFTSLNTNVIEIEFFVSGSREPATVSGFGAVFTDVDTAGSTSLEFFDVNGTSIFSRNVLATPGNESLSFLGATFDRAQIARVRMTSGNAVLGANDVTQSGASDIVVMDDFIYGEPVVVAPLKPIITSPVDGSQIGSEFITVSGVAERNSIVELFEGTTSLGTATTGDDRIWKITPQVLLTNGSHTFTARATNSAGTSDPSDGVSLTIATADRNKTCLTPNAPSIGALNKPGISKAGKKQITIQMDDYGSQVGYFVRTTCRKGGRKATSSAVYFSNSVTIKRPRGQRCTFVYSIIANGAESAQSPKGK